MPENSVSVSVKRNKFNTSTTMDIMKIATFSLTMTFGDIDC